MRGRKAVGGSVLLLWRKREMMEWAEWAAPTTIHSLAYNSSRTSTVPVYTNVLMCQKNVLQIPNTPWYVSTSLISLILLCVTANVLQHMFDILSQLEHGLAEAVQPTAASSAAPAAINSRTSSVPAWRQHEVRAQTFQQWIVHVLLPLKPLKHRPAERHGM